MHGAGRHHLDPVAVRELAVDDADIRHDAPVGVVDRVEDQGARRRVRVALGRRDLVDDQVEQLLDALAGLGRDPQDVIGVAADDAGDLLGVLLRLRAGQVDLVEHRDDVEVRVDREVEVGEGLRLDPLGRVDEQDSAFARLEAAADLIGEVDVSGGVDHVEHVDRAGVVTAGLHERHAYGLALDRDAALALDVHAVEVLRLHVAAVDDTGVLQHAVGQRRLAVVDVRDDAEVAQDLRVGGPGLGNGAGAHDGSIVPSPQRYSCHPPSAPFASEAVCGRTWAKRGRSEVRCASRRWALSSPRFAAGGFAAYAHGRFAP